MFSLFSGMWKSMREKDDYFVLLVGLDRSGKTTLLERIKCIYNKTPMKERIVSTVGLNVGKIMVSQSRLNFWDLGGEAQLQSLWPKYYSQAHALIYVIDAGSLTRLDESIDILNGILEFEEIINISMLVIVNKIDIEGGTSVAEVKERIDAVIGKERELTVLSASAKEGGVVECVEWIHKTVIANTTARPPSKS